MRRDRESLRAFLARAWRRLNEPVPERPEPGHTIAGPHYDIAGHDHTRCRLTLPHCGPCWIPGDRADRRPNK